jgi:predicted DCC family thiol-disulfide oxidoreductase YuxK
MHASQEDKAIVEIVYDSLCPACAAYFRLQRLRANGIEPIMIDARALGNGLDAYSARGINLDRDLVVRYLGCEYVGGDAMFVLARLGSRGILAMALNAILFGNRRISRLVYPVLRAARLLLLRVLGRPRIHENHC